MNPLDLLQSVPTDLGAEVWQATLRPETDLSPFLAVLSLAEHERLARYGKPELGRQFVFRRGLLRLLLGDRTGVGATELRFSEGPLGKPILDGGPSFSVSQSDQYVLYALYDLSSKLAVGVDVELISLPRMKSEPSTPLGGDRVRRGMILPRIAPGGWVRGQTLEFEQLLQQFFTASEREYIAVQGERAFYQIWTRKEACVKALGVGLREPLDRLDVLQPDARFQIQDLDIGSDACASVALTSFVTMSENGEYEKT